MQNTHVEEVAMLYVLFDKHDAGEETPELAAQLETIVVHTHAHFERENEKMIALNFPPYTVYKQVHDEYLEPLDTVVITWTASQDLAPVFTFFELATPQWLNQHSSTMDYMNTNFFKIDEGS
ncbi:MAG: hemerythrin family protein [Ghiorsea sp.]|nr:hemerythrin family protein [Ghiorsea sp.]